MDRRCHRRDRPGRRGRWRRARSDLPAAAPDRCREPPRARVRLPDPAGLGRSTCSRTRRPSSRHFDRALPPTWRFDTWAIIKTVEHDFGQWVRGQLILGFAVGVFTFIGLIVLSYTRGPDLRALRGPVVDHRGRPRAGPDHRPDHLGDPRGPAGGDRRDRSRSWPHSSSTSLVQQVENNFFVPKIQGDAIQLHPAAVIFAIIIGGALAGLLGAILALPDDRGLPRRRALPLPASLPGRAGSPGGIARDDRDGPGGWLDRCLTSTRTRSCRSTPRPRTR